MNSYRHFCGVAKALDVVGERWTLLIVRDLLLGPRRFSELERSLAGITPNLLSKRLATLSEANLVDRVESSSFTRAYALTAHGRSLEPVILGLGSFGAAYLTKPDRGDHLNPRAAMVALKRRYRGSRCSAIIGLEVGVQPFGVEIGGAALEVYDGVPARPDLRLEGAEQHWFPLLTGQRGLGELEQEQKIVRRGSLRLARAFVRCIGARV